MDSILAHFAEYYVSLNAQTAEFAYENTLDGSELRLFIKDLITTRGPSHEKILAALGSSRRNKFTEEWVLLLVKGGDIVEDCVVLGFKEWSTEEILPWSKSIVRSISEMLMRTFVCRNGYLLPSSISS